MNKCIFTVEEGQGTRFNQTILTNSFWTRQIVISITYIYVVLHIYIHTHYEYEVFLMYYEDSVRPINNSSDMNSAHAWHEGNQFLKTYNCAAFHLQLWLTRTGKLPNAAFWSAALSANYWLLRRKNCGFSKGIFPFFFFTQLGRYLERGGGVNRAKRIFKGSGYADAAGLVGRVIFFWAHEYVEIFIFR